MPERHASDCVLPPNFAPSALPFMRVAARLWLGFTYLCQDPWVKVVLNPEARSPGGLCG